MTNQYKIENSRGLSGGGWIRTYDSLADAKVAIADEMGWDDVCVSDSFTVVDDGSEVEAYDAYDSPESMEADTQCAYGVRIIEAGSEDDGNSEDEA